MDDAMILNLRASVLAAELERLRGIGIPLEHAAALVAKILAAAPVGEREVRPVAAYRAALPSRRHWRLARAG